MLRKVETFRLRARRRSAQGDREAVIPSVAQRNRGISTERYANHYEPQRRILRHVEMSRLRGKAPPLDMTCFFVTPSLSRGLDGRISVNPCKPQRRMCRKVGTFRLRASPSEGTRPDHQDYCPMPVMPEPPPLLPDCMSSFEIVREARFTVTFCLPKRQLRLTIIRREERFR